MKLSRPLLRMLVVALVWTLIGFLVLPSKAGAEYRIYQLLIQNTETNTSRTVLSILDHLQYPTYYPLNKSETVQYVDSWMCWENSSYFKKPCPKPQRNVASTPAAKGAMNSASTSVAPPAQPLAKPASP